MDKLKMHSPNLTDANIAKLAEIFPSCMTEAADGKGGVKKAIDFDLLRQELSDHIVDGSQERYRLDWPGKKEALITANAPVGSTLRPILEESVDFKNTKNIFIEGDNLDALKLIQETYLGKVKLIYIDPPYNTGNDFVYSDDFAQGADEYLEQSLQRGADGSRFTTNAAASGRFHSVWMSMMFARLRLARNILSDDGVIFISIDDGEQANLKKICDEIFGENNFIADAIWRSKDNSNNDAKRFSTDHNHTLIYAKNPDWEPAKLNDEAKRSHFKNPDNDPRGPYFDGNPLNSPAYRANLVFDLISPNGNIIKPPKNGWRWSRETLNEKIALGEIKFTEDGKSIRRRTYLADMKGLPPSTLWIDLEKTGHNRQAKYELVKLIPEDVFDTPKPVKLINFILDLCSLQSGDVVLDFFSGSGTTAHAVMQYSASLGIDLRFVMIQIAEPVPSDSDAAKAGYSTIADISKERIRRAGKKVLEGECHPEWNRDVGFRVLKVDTSNMKQVYYTPDAVSQDLLSEQVDNIREDRTPEDLLFQVLLDWGVDLALPISQQSIAGKTVFFVDGNALAACFDTGIDEDFVKALAGYKPLRVVFRDAGFASDSVKINVEQVFKLLSPTTEIKTL